MFNMENVRVGKVWRRKYEKSKNVERERSKLFKICSSTSYPERNKLIIERVKE